VEEEAEEVGEKSAKNSQYSLVKPKMSCEGPE